ncbi:cold-regulated 413 inner membrane protein 1, chloroplastic-like [Apium graveolens]|uniref:cold-regulated 413 inner membrane protein 1, chloroplastic-like n=1 Tax=Apium graveolens TaxID=4045 RepID=UPI003D7A9385
MLQRKGGFSSTVCSYAPLSSLNLQWINTISSAILMLASGTSIQKPFLVPIFALQAPASIISWIKGEYGVWTAFLALLISLFFHIPGELELPFNALLLVLVAPYQILNLRGKLEGIILSLTIAGYLAFQHFSRAGSLRKAFDQGSIIATICMICVLTVPCLLLIGC